MIPSADIRLASMSSAVTGAFIPALGGSNPFALEQAQLLVGHLAVIRAQESIADEFEHLDFNGYRAFARELIDASEGGTATTSAVTVLRALLAGPVPYTTAGVRDAHHTLAGAIGDLIEAVGVDGTDESVDRTQEIGIRYERANAIRLRSYFALMGYEDGTSVIPSLPDMMTEFRAAYGEHPS